MRLLINQAWPLEFPDEYDEGDKTSFLYWVHHHFPAVQVHAAAQLYCYKDLRDLIKTPKISTVVEFFGGSGIGTTIIQRLFEPQLHCVYDIDPACVKHLQAQEFSDCVDVWQGDAHEVMLEEADYPDYRLHLAACDFFSFSAYRIPEWREQFDAIFAKKPYGVQITDTSIARLPLQRKRYAEALGRDFTTTPEYLMAFSNWIWEHYGYVATSIAYREFACYMFAPYESKVWSPEEERDNPYHPRIYKLTQEDGNVAVMKW